MTVVQGQSLSFQHLNKQRGFSQSVCYDVLKDREGFVWITTISGLYRYDGNRFEDITQGNDALKGHALVSLIEDQKGDLWISRFSDELVRYKQQQKSFEIIALGALSAQVPPDLTILRLLHVDQHNRIWMQLNDALLACFDPEHNTIQYIDDESLEILRLFPQGDLNTQQHLAAIRKRDGVILKGTLDDQMRLQWSDSISDWPERPSALAMTDTAHLWGIAGNRLLRYSFSQKTTATYPMEVLAPENYDTGSLHIDPNGNLWLSAGEGLLQISTKPEPRATYHLHRANDAYSIAGRATAHHIDRDGILWTAVYGKGISYALLSSPRFPNILTQESAYLQGASNYVRALCASDDGSVFTALQSGGVIELDNNYIITARALPAEAGVVEHLLCEKGRGLWMAGKALYLLKEIGQMPVAFTPLEQNFTGFTALHRAFDGQLLAGGYQCLYHFDEASSSFQLPEGIAQNGTYCVLHSLDASHLLACRRDEGVALYSKNGDSYTLVKEVDANLYVKCIAKAKDGNLLMATTTGLYRYDEKTHTATPVEDVNRRLPNMYMYSVLQDDDGRYWASTNDGLCAWEGEGEDFQWFDMGHGLQDLEFNTNAFCKMPSGDLLFGGVSGINLVAKNMDFTSPSPKPPLHILSLASRDVELGDGNIPLGAEAIFMGWGTNALELEYALLEYFRPERVRVRYRLQGHDDDWQQGPSHGRVRFANVAPGRYTYEMQVADANGLWDNEVRSWELLIRPLWWQTWWARAAAILVVLAVAVFAVKVYTTRKLQQQREAIVREVAVQQERERITADLHDDIGATLSSMYLYGDLANTVWQEKPEESRKMLGTITVQSQELMQRMSDIVWSLKSAGDQGGTISMRLRNYAHELLSGKGLAVRFEVDEALDGEIVNPVARKNLLLIGKEALNNAAKYSNAARVHVALYRDEAYMYMRIEDDGDGFDPESRRVGNGLDNMRTRCEKMGGKMHITAAPGGGCTILACLPIAIISQGIAS